APICYASWMTENRSETQSRYPQIWTTCFCTPFSSQARDKHELSLFGGQKRHPAALYTDCTGAVPVPEYGQNYCRLSHRRDTARCGQYERNENRIRQNI